MLKYTTVAFCMVAVGCSSPTAPTTINDGPVVAMASTSATLTAGRAYWTSDALILELGQRDSGCDASPPTPGDVTVSVTVPRALAVPGDLPITSDLLDRADIDVAVTELDEGLASSTWLLDGGLLRLRDVGDVQVVGGLVGSDAGGRGVNGMFTLPACGTR